jgi:uncharacterized protein YijF (DUF1287 family)
MEQQIEQLVRQLTVDLFKIVNESLNNNFISSFGGSTSSDLIKIKIRKTTVNLNTALEKHDTNLILETTQQLSGFVMGEVVLNKLNVGLSDNILEQIDKIQKLVNKENFKWH